MKAEEFGLHLRRLRKQAKMTIRQLELKCGVSNAYLSQLENGKRTIPSPEILRKLAYGLGVSYEDLMELAGYLDSPAADPGEDDNIFPVGPIRNIPIVAEIPCGEPMIIEDNIIGYFPVDTSIVNLNGGTYVWLKAKGDSMTGANIHDGSFVLIRIQPEVEERDIAAVCIDNESATLKRITFSEDMVILSPENSNMSPTAYQRSRVRIVGKATMVVNNLGQL